MGTRRKEKGGGIFEQRDISFLGVPVSWDMDSECRLKCISAILFDALRKVKRLSDLGHSDLDDIPYLP